MSKRSLFSVVLCITLAGVLGLVLVFRTRPPEKRTLIGFDTWIDIELPHAHRSFFPELAGMIDQWDRRWNRYDSGSLVWQLNQSSDWVPLDPETFELFALARRYEEATGGFFTVTIGALVDGWDILSETPVVLSPEEIAQMVELTAETEVEIRENDWAVRREGRGVIDLGGIAKGYLVDLLVESLRNRLSTPALINAGGTVYGLEREVRVGIPHPREQGLIGVVTIKNQAISTSGDYYRFFLKDGFRYHHIINPFDGYPGRDFSSVTVVTETATESDVLSTAVMAGGHAAFQHVVQVFPEAAVIAVDSEGILTMNQPGEAFFTPFARPQEEQGAPGT